MRQFRQPDRRAHQDPSRVRLSAPPPQPADLSPITDLLPRGGAPRLEPAAAREIVSALLRAMELSFLPQPATTLESYVRSCHQDLSDLSDQELWQETSRAAFLLAWCERARWHPWVLERSERCQRELQRRRQGGRHAR